MPTIYTTLSTLFPATLAALQGRVYLANDDDPLLTWDGAWATMRPAGIVSPAAAPTAPTAGSGSVTAGAHRVRYRYVDVATGYVSNPSDEIVLAGTGSNGWTFVVGTHLTASADPKVTHIALEVTLANGTVFYRLGLVPNSGGSIAYHQADTAVMLLDVVGTLHDDFGHGVPPMASCVCAHRGRLFMGGGRQRSVMATLTTGSATVSGTGFNPRWIGRMLQVDSEHQLYCIDNATPTALTLHAAYSGTSGTKTVLIKPLVDRLYWSLPLFPESFDRLKRQRVVVPGDAITALVSYDNELWIFGRHSVDRLAYTLDPGVSEGVVVPVSRWRGAVNQACVVPFGGRLFVLDGSGVYTLPDLKPWSDPAQREFATAQWANSDRFFGFAVPAEDTVGWCVAWELQHGVATTKAVCLHVPSGRWWTERYDHDLRGAMSGADASGRSVLIAGDHAGRVWALRAAGRGDGVAAGDAQRTVASSSSPTAVTLTAAVPAGASPGVVVMRAATGSRARLASASGSSITLESPGFDAAPAAGEALWFGPVSWRYTTKWVRVPGSLGQRVYLHLRFRPAPQTSWMRVYFRRDFDAVDETLTVHSASYGFPDGVRLGDGTVTSATYMSVDISRPSVSVPVPAEWCEYWQVRLEHDDPRCEPRLLDLDLTHRDAPAWVAET